MKNRRRKKQKQKGGILSNRYRIFLYTGVKLDSAFEIIKALF